MQARIEGPRGRNVAWLGLLLYGLSVSAAASDDWDWDAFEPIDDAPVIRSTAPAAADLAPRPASSAAPDLAAPPVPAIPLFAGLAPFEVVPSRRDEEMHPCANCHQWVTSNPEPRALQAPHDNFELRHGLHGHGGFWCFTCHRADKDVGLQTLEGEPVEFADAYVVCSQCHASQAHDWAHGAHGKRLGDWKGPRRVLNCTACHYQHRPALAPRAPMPGPVMRAGLPRPAGWRPASQRANHRAEHEADWQREVERRREAAGHSHAPAEPATAQAGIADEDS